MHTAMSTKSNEELIRELKTDGNLTDCEQELLDRLVAAIDEVAALEAEVTAHRRGER